MRECDGAVEVFMLRRHQQIAFMGGAYVFPGGRIDPHDAPLPDDTGWLTGIERVRSRLHDLDASLAIAHGVAAIRELFEEAGVLLARTAEGMPLTFEAPSERDRYEQLRHDLHDGRVTLRELAIAERLTISIDDLVPFAHWVTPAMEARRFDARFFIARVPEHQHPVHEARESTESQWIRPADALRRAERGEMWLPVPTWQTLRALEPLSTIEDLLRWADVQPIVRTEPLYHEEGGTKMFLVPGDPLFPTEPGQFVGPETRFVFDGSRWNATTVKSRTR
jgi:8-oxo-dGTP pyrophosphatase MutT (NUDIX family)